MELHPLRGGFRAGSNANKFAIGKRGRLHGEGLAAWQTEGREANLVLDFRTAFNLALKRHERIHTPCLLSLGPIPRAIGRFNESPALVSAVDGCLPGGGRDAADARSPFGTVALAESAAPRQYPPQCGIRERVLCGRWRTWSDPHLDGRHKLDSKGFGLNGRASWLCVRRWSIRGGRRLWDRADFH